MVSDGDGNGGLNLNLLTFYDAESSGSGRNICTRISHHRRPLLPHSNPSRRWYARACKME